MKTHEYQIEYEYLVKHAESEKVYFRNLCEERENLRAEIMTTDSYMKVIELQNRIAYKNKVIAGSKKTLKNISDKLAVLLKIAIFEP